MIGFIELTRRTGRPVFVEVSRIAAYAPLDEDYPQSYATTGFSATRSANCWLAVSGFRSFLYVREDIEQVKNKISEEMWKMKGTGHPQALAHPAQPD